MTYLQQMHIVNQLDQKADTARLNGKVFKAKTMNPTRLKGLAALGVSGLAYSNLMMLSLMMGPTIPMATVAASALYGMYSFSDKEYVSAIEASENGGLKLTIQKSVFASYTIHTNA